MGTKSKLRILQDKLTVLRDKHLESHFIVHEARESCEEYNDLINAIGKLTLKPKERKKTVYKPKPNEVKALQNGEGDWYVIPVREAAEFDEDLDNTYMVDSGDFDDKWGEYATGGDLNLTQLYTFN